MTYLLFLPLVVITVPIAVLGLAFLSALVQGEALYRPVVYQRRPKR